jgi:hypothetical protein
MEVNMKKEDRELVLPSSHSLIDDSEMEYVEGGNGFFNSTVVVGIAIDVAIAVITTGVALSSKAVAVFIKNNIAKIKSFVQAVAKKYLVLLVPNKRRGLIRDLIS